MEGGGAAEISTKGTILAALFLANRPLTMESLSQTANCKPEDLEGHIAELQDDLKNSNSPFRVNVFEDPEKLSGSQVKLELEERYLQAVSHLSQQIEMSKKAQKILALIANKKELLQSELKYYFKGDVYEAVEELVQRKYLIEERYKTTKRLKPTKLFFEKFKMVQESAV